MSRRGLELAAFVAAITLVITASVATLGGEPTMDDVRVEPGWHPRAQPGPADEPRTPSDVAPYVDGSRRLARLAQGMSAEQRAARFGPTFAVASAPSEGFVAVTGHRLLFLDAALAPRAVHELGARSVSRPAVAADGTAYVGTQDERLLAVAPDGRLRWSYRARADLDAAPVITSDGAIFAAGDDGRLLAFEPDGKLRFVLAIGAPIHGGLVSTSDGSVVAATMGPRPRVVAIDARTGRMRWRHRAAFTDAADEGLSAGVTLDGAGRIYVAGDAESILVLSAQGRELGSLYAHCPVAFPPILGADGSLLYACGADGELLRAPTALR